MNFKIKTGKEYPNIRELQHDLIMSAWPEFMFHDIYIAKYWDAVLDRCPEYQYVLMDEADNKVLGLGNSFPLVWDGSLNNLPANGLDGALEKAPNDLTGQAKPDLQCAFQIVVDKSLHSTGFSYEIVKAMIQIGKDLGLQALVAPVRPNLKSRYPLTPIENYITWTDSDNHPFDAWMRVHTKLGGEIIKVCPESMLIEGTVAEWEKWIGIKFPESGRYIIPGALVPITIDRENDRGEYIEPNVWMAHRL